MKRTRWWLVTAGLLVAVACGQQEGRERDDDDDDDEAGELSARELERGIGPVEELALADVDASLAAHGAQLFQLKCSACHQLDARYVGPPLRDVTDRRRPEYVMNMMLNPAEMLTRHPTARQLLAEYYTPMPAQDLTMEDARALLEYLRQAAREQPTPTGAGT